MNFPGFCPEPAKGFVLAPNKDLAVSFWHYCQSRPIPCGMGARPFRVYGVSVRTSSRRSGRRLLAAIFLSFTDKSVQEGVRTFLPLAVIAKKRLLVLLGCFNYINILYLCQGVGKKPKKD